MTYINTDAVCAKRLSIRTYVYMHDIEHFDIENTN